MSNKFLAPALLGTTVALSGCGEKDDVVQSCSYDQNVAYVNPTDPNSLRLYYRGLLHPILVACSQEVQQETTVRGSISYGRSVSMTNPSTGNIQDTSVPDAKAIQNFVSELNLAPKIDDRVRPYYPMNTQATINIRRGYVATTASSEGLVEGGDSSLFMETPQNKGNAIIAKIRAQGIIQSIKKALQKSQAKVVGLENIEYTSSQTHLTNEEFGELSQAALRAYGNGANRAMQLVVAYNTKKLPENVDVAMLKRIIDAKRKGDVMLVVTTKGTKQTVDISNWSYVLLLALFGGVTTVGVRKIDKMIKEHKRGF